LDSWSLGAGFYSYYIHQGNKSDKERKIVRKKLSFMHTKRFNTFFKRWVQFHVGPRLPTISFLSSTLFSLKPKLINHDQLFKILTFFLPKLIKRKYFS